MRRLVSLFLLATAACAFEGCKKGHTKTAVVSVSVSHLKPNGRAWDADENGLDARPDLAVCISYADARHCYNGDKPNLSEAVCRDALTCQAKLELPPSGTVAIEVWDIDAASEELIARGKCDYGATCDLGGCVVAIADDTKALPEPPPAKLDACGSAPFDAAKIATLPTNPLRGHPINRRKGTDVDIYDYEGPKCGAVMLSVDSDDPTSWAFRCRRSCIDPKAAGLGTLAPLVTDDTDAGARATWYLVSDGPLKGAIAAFTPLAEGGNEIAVQSVTGIQDEPSYFIASWLCKNPSRAPGVNPSKCQ